MCPDITIRASLLYFNLAHMFKSRALWLGFCSVVCSLGLLAQDCNHTLRGYVRESGTELPLAYATIFVREASKNVSSDERGYFTISNLCANTAYTVEVRHLECEHFTQIVRVLDNVELCFHLHHDNTLPEVLVHEKAVAPQPTQVASTVGQADLLAAQGLSLGETLKKLPGVALLNTGSTIAKPVIQGLHSNRIALVNNGVALESQQWGSEHAPEIDPFTANKVSVLKGAAGVRYGVGAMAGVVLLEPSPLRTESGMGGWISLGGFSNGRSGVAAGSLDWRLPNSSLTFRVQGTAKRSGNLHAPDYFLGNTGAAELNFSAMAGWKSGKWRHEISASRFSQQIGVMRSAHVGNLTDLLRAIDSPTPLNNLDQFSYDLNRPFQTVQHQTIKFRTERRLSDIWKLSGQYSFQFNNRREYDVVRSTGVAASKAQIAFRLWTNTLDFALEHFPIRHFQGGIGVQAQQQTNFVSKGGFIPDYQSMGGGIWVTERWRKFHNPWELELGLRYDFRQTNATTSGNLNNLDTLVRFGNASGTFGILYHLGRDLTFSLNTGQAWRPPHVNELFARGVHHGAGTYEEGRSDLLPEKAWNTNLSARFERQRWFGMLSVYRNTIRDFIYLDPSLTTVLTVRGAFPAFYYRQAEQAVIQGIEGNVGIPLPWGLSAEGGFSILRGQRLLPGSEAGHDWLPLMPSDRFQYGLRWGKTRKKPAEAQPNQAEAETFVRLNATSVRRQSLIPAEGLLKAAPAGFTLLSFDAAHTFFLRRGRMPLEIGLNIQNLTHLRYREYLNFFRLYADEPGFNLGLRAKLNF